MIQRTALIAGWFSFTNGHATAGDLLALDVTRNWLTEANFTFDVALDPPFAGGLDWRTAEPEKYSHLIFVCGPFHPGLLEAQLLGRFSKCKLIGLNLSMLEPVKSWNPFDFLLERNSDLTTRPDMVFASKELMVPVVGICLVENYEGASVHDANEAIQRLVQGNKIAIVNIDTRLDENQTFLRSPAEIESLISRMDVLLTTRLHGAVLALKNGVPVVVIDPEAGGFKLSVQMQKVGWPIAVNVDNLTDEFLQKGLEYCLTEQAREKATECYKTALASIADTRNYFLEKLNNSDDVENIYLQRLADEHSRDWHENILMVHSRIPKESNKIIRKRKFINGAIKIYRLTKRLKSEISKRF